jgi:hypothetical protein
MVENSFVIFVSFVVKNYLNHTTATDHGQRTTYLPALSLSL